MKKSISRREIEEKIEQIKKIRDSRGSHYTRTKYNFTIGTLMGLLQ